MKKEEFAQLINGRQYREELTPQEEKIAKDNNLLVVFGASDDLMEFRGVIYDELGCFEGATCYLYNKELVSRDKNFDDLDEQIKFLKKYGVTGFKSIEALRCHGDSSWSYKTEIPHSTFNIYDDDELYCIGIVINGDDLS